MPSRDAEARLDYVIRARDAEFARVSKRVLDRLDRLEKQGLRASNALTSISGVLNRLGFSFRSLLGAAGIGGATAAFNTFVGGVNRSVSAIDTLAKQARNLDLNITQLQAWSQAAVEGGISLGDFQRNMELLQRRIGEVSTGLNRESATAFNALNVQLRTSRGEIRRTGEVFLDVVESLDRLPSGERAAVAQQLFGRGGFTVGLASVTNRLGADAFRQREEVYGRFGITERQGRLAEQAQNRLDVAQVQLGRAAERMGFLADQAFEITRTQVQISETLLGAFISLGDFFYERGVRSRGRRAGNLGRGTAFYEIDRTEYGSPQAQQTGLPFEPNLSREERLALRAQAAARFASNDAARRRDRGRYLTRTQLNQRARDAQRAARIAAEEAAEEAERERLYQARQESNRGAARRRRGFYLRTRFPVDPTAARRSSEGRIYSGPEGYRARFEERVSAEEALEEYDRRQERFNNLVRDTGRNFQSAAQAIVSGTQTAGDALQAFVDRLLLDIVNRTVIEPLSNLASTALITLLGGATPRAGGGPVRAGHPYIIGERGPELFVPRGAGTVVPNSAVRASVGAAPNIAITYQINSTDGPGVRAALAEASPRLRADAVAAVTQSLQRPGSELARTVRG